MLGLVILVFDEHHQTTLWLLAALAAALLASFPLHSYLLTASLCTCC